MDNLDELLEKLGFVANILQILNYIENTKQAKQLEEIYYIVNKIDEDLKSFKQNQELVLQKLDFLINNIKSES